MKVVARTNSVDVPQEYRMEENDDWYFDNKMTDIKKTSCKTYATMHKSARSNQKKSQVSLRDKDMRALREGSFQVSKEYVRFLKSTDTGDTKVRDRCIVLMANNFSTHKKNAKERYLRLSKHIRKLPPFDHAVKVKKRANGKFVLQIPCDPSYTRRSSTKTPDSICGIDPGGRTFATVYDPTNANAFQVGLEEDKKSVMRAWHNKIDETHWHLKNAQKRSQRQAQDDRTSQLKKLHLKLKTFVDDIHLKLSSHLVKSYRFVALGKIPVSQIVKKDRPKHLNKRANRDLLCWRHYNFRQRLLHRATESDCHVVVQDESYTSMTCGKCGTRNSTLGASETIYVQGMWLWDTPRYQWCKEHLAEGARLFRCFNLVTNKVDFPYRGLIEMPQAVHLIVRFETLRLLWGN